MAEPMNRTLLEMTRAMLKQINTLKPFWGAAVVTASYIRNKITYLGISQNLTVLGTWTKHKADVGQLRVFRTTCWYHIRKEDFHKFGAREETVILIGYAKTKKHTNCRMNHFKKVIISRDVTFD